MANRTDNHASVDFFVSYTHTDRAWAEWITHELEAATYLVHVQAWDFRPGQDFVHEMHGASQRARCTLALLSESYLTASPMGEAEWRAAFADDPSGADRRLIPVRVGRCRPLGLLSSRIYIDLVGLDENAARRELLAGVALGRARPSDPPPFPGSATAPSGGR